MKRGFILLFLLPLWLSAQELWCPEPTNRLVNDYSGVLSSQDRIALEERLVAFDDSTSNQILVVILPSLHDCEIMEFILPRDNSTSKITYGFRLTISPA